MDFPPIELFIGKVDVIHGTNAVLPPACFARGVITVHDLSPILYPQLCQPNFLPFADLVKRAVSRGALVHTPSEYVKGEIIDVLGVPEDRVFVVPLGVPTDTVTPSTIEQEHDFHRMELPKLFVLAIGTIQPRKDYKSLLLAFDILAKKNDEVNLIIAGGNGWGYEEFIKVLAGLSAKNRVRHLGFVTEAQRAELLSRATILVYPSVYEGFGLPPLEAMAHAVPVVATIAGSIPEIVGEAALLVPIGEPYAIAEQLSLLLESETLRTEMIRRGLERASNFTWKKTADGLADLYRLAGS